jgi:phosphoglycerate kinase
MDFLPSYAGIEMEREIEELTRLLDNVLRPYLLIVGGAKVEDKAPLIDGLKNKVDKVLIGGRTANLLHQEKKYQGDKKIILNIDGIGQNKKIVPVDGGDPMAVFDIGPETVKLFKEEVKKAKTVLIAGPLGKIEEDDFATGTKEIYKAVSELRGYKVACGGDTIQALNKFGLFNKFSFVSTGGGAALEFLAKGTLPAVSKLNSSSQISDSVG